MCLNIHCDYEGLLRCTRTVIRKSSWLVLRIHYTATPAHYVYAYLDSCCSRGVFLHTSQQTSTSGLKTHGMTSHNQ